VYKICGQISFSLYKTHKELKIQLKPLNQQPFPFLSDRAREIEYTKLGFCSQRKNGERERERERERELMDRLRPRERHVFSGFTKAEVIQACSFSFYLFIFIFIV
jgi:hypothetical protein